MAKSKKTPSGPVEVRKSMRLAGLAKPAAVEKKRVQKAPKPKKTKQAENGNKAEEPKAEAADAK